MGMNLIRTQCCCFFFSGMSSTNTIYNLVSIICLQLGNMLEYLKYCQDHKNGNQQHRIEFVRVLYE